MWQKLKLMSLKQFSSSVKCIHYILLLLPATLCSQSKIIWSESQRIAKANANGSNIETIVSRQAPIDIEAVPEEQKVY